ncbi:MAG TPA: MBOAT family protein [Opitutaceae bacterium]|nr:MBOAT family protein [Opitutaceae bacterium]HOR25029.1 MBOAT family protein [Opitutaceae bacterium]HPK49308.1 MBOAT family protein [Opitutaceae bacterium]
MVFSSLIFLYVFLPVFLTSYYLAPIRWRNHVALIGSLLFYAWGEPVFAGVLILSSLCDYGLSHCLANPGKGPAYRRGVLTVGLILNLGLLGYFKYANFFVGQTNGLLAWLGQGSLVWTHIALPIGISFFTFQKISYLVDVYRGTAKPARSFTDFLLFVALFPQLIAGPIIRYHDVAEQIRERAHTADKFLSGLWRFTLGLGKKVLIANQLGAVADLLFKQEIATLPMPYAWTAILCYTFQIYFDFAGYSDMAIGLGRMMGFEFAENFNHPYTARSVTDFWRRWHCSLSTFMRDYLYIPLGGNRGRAWRTGLNLWLVFLASGFWHGASWNFVAWGAYHGTFLSLEKGFRHGRLAHIPAVLSWAFTFLVICCGWVIFRTETIADAGHFLQRMIAFDSWSGVTDRVGLFWPDVISHRATGMLVLAAIVSFIPDTVWTRWGWDQACPTTRWQSAGRIALGTICLLLATASLANQSYNPFIYFRF